MKLLYICIFFTITILISTAGNKNLNPEEKNIIRNAADLKEKLIKAKKSFKFKKLKNSKSKINISESIFIIKDKTLSASAFYTSLWGIPVGITNAHNIALMQKPTISDGKGNSYRIKAMLALPEQDIIIFKIDNIGIMETIPLAYNLTQFPLNSPVLAYGNNQKQGIITKQKGVIQNIKNKENEISTVISPSYSGGPLLCKNKVIGVLKYPTQSTPDKLNLQGTLFEGKNIYLEKYYGPPKSFATCINSIDPDKLEIFNAIENTKDIEIIKELMNANNKALKYKIKIIEIILKGKKSPQKLIRSAWALVHMNQNLKKTIEDCYSQLSIDPNQYTCSDKILAKQFREELSIYRRNSQVWDFEELFNSQDPAFRKNFISIAKKLKRHFQIAPKCRFCKGKGYRIVEIDNPAYRQNKMKFAFKTTYVKCEQCNGTGKIVVSKYYYLLKNKQYVNKFSKPLKISFLGLIPGSDKFASISARRKMLFVRKVRSDISNTYIYSKTPRFPLANSVFLNYVMGRLQEIKIYFPYSKELYQHMKKRLEKKYGKCTWETEDKSTFCQLDRPDYKITIGQTYKISAKSKLKKSLYISCKHKELSKAKLVFSHLRYNASKVKDFKLNPPNNTNTGF